MAEPHREARSSRAHREDLGKKEREQKKRDARRAMGEKETGGGGRGGAEK